MDHPSPDHRPLLIIVSGRPGSGKTTLAHSLARAIRCPLISRDQIKEGMLNTVGADVSSTDADLTRRAYDTFFQTIELLLSRGVTLVAEAAFQHKVWAPRLEPLLNIARVRIIVCHLAPELARVRHFERTQADPNRRRFHEDPAVHADYDPPRLNVPSLAVDTSDGYRPAFEQIVAFATDQVSQRKPSTNSHE
ncbi:MAG TPA: ATP-binding protein [Tepidisphaeraceae bacterium]|jgi:predicted kinase